MQHFRCVHEQLNFHTLSFLPFFLSSFFFDFSQQIDSSYINIYQILWNYFSLYVLRYDMICYKVRWWPFLFNGLLMIMWNVIHNHFYDYFITITLIQLMVNFVRYGRQTRPASDNLSEARIYCLNGEFKSESLNRVRFGQHQQWLVALIHQKAYCNSPKILIHLIKHLIRRSLLFLLVNIF